MSDRIIVAFFLIMSRTSNFKSAKIRIMFLFYVLSFYKIGDTIHRGTLFKGGHYLRKYGILKIVGFLDTI